MLRWWLIRRHDGDSRDILWTAFVAWSCNRRYHDMSLQRGYSTHTVMERERERERAEREGGKVSRRRRRVSGWRLARSSSIILAFLVTQRSSATLTESVLMMAAAAAATARTRDVIRPTDVRRSCSVQLAARRLDSRATMPPLPRAAARHCRRQCSAHVVQPYCTTVDAVQRS